MSYRAIPISWKVLLPFAREPLEYDTEINDRSRYSHVPCEPCIQLFLSQNSMHLIAILACGNSKIDLQRGEYEVLMASNGAGLNKARSALFELRQAKENRTSTYRAIARA